MKLSYYKCTVTTCVPESINFFEDEEIWHYGLPYKMILKEVEQHYKDGADAVELEMITQKEFDLHLDLEQQIITPEEFDDQLPKPY